MSDPQGIRARGYRYYCGDGRCMWMHPLEKEDGRPHWIDCTDMSDDEFAAFLEAGGDKVTAEVKQ